VIEVQTLLQTFPILTTFGSAFNTTLINGKGRYLGGPQDVPLAVVSVTHGKRWVLILFTCLGIGLKQPLPSGTGSAWFLCPVTLASCFPSTVTSSL
jgi:hypothetical protein